MKLTIRKKIAAVTLAACVGFTTQSALAFFPVTNPTELVQSIIQVRHLLNQLQELKQQVSQAEREFQSMYGSRGLAGLINSEYDPTIAIRPEDVLNMLNQLGLKNAQDYNLPADVGTLFDQRNKTAALFASQSEKSLKQSQDRFQELSRLVAEVNNSPDPKDIMDLQARIGAEEVLLQNEMTKLTMLQSQAQANEALHEQKVKQLAIESSGTLSTVAW